MKTIIFRWSVALVALIYVSVAATVCWPRGGREEELKRLQAQQMVLDEASVYATRFAQKLVTLHPEEKEDRAALNVLKGMSDPLDGNSADVKGVGNWKLGLAAEVFFHRDEQAPEENRAVVFLLGRTVNSSEILLLQSDERGELRSVQIADTEGDSTFELVVEYVPRTGRMQRDVYRASEQGFEKSK